MADPTIQTFCCHRPNDTNSPVNILIEFHSDVYNSICVTSSVIGIFGAIYQILPRTRTSQRLDDFSTARGRYIIKWLAVADMFASMGVFIRSLLWINNKGLVPAISDTTVSIFFCAISSAWIQYFYTATWFWTLCYAIDVRRILKAQRLHQDIPEFSTCYHILSWLSPAGLTLFGLVILYAPNARCHNLTTLSGVLLHILPNYCATFLPMVAIMITNPILYALSARDVEMNIAVRYAQFTQRERKTVHALKIKFLFFTLVFYMCWLPNLICSIVIWSLWINLPRTFIIMLWYFMAVMNPLQALLNSVVYRKWLSEEHIHIPCLNWCRSNTEAQERQIIASSSSSGFIWLNKRKGSYVAVKPSLKYEDFSNGSFLIIKIEKA